MQKYLITLPVFMFHKMWHLQFHLLAWGDGKDDEDDNALAFSNF